MPTQSNLAMTLTLAGAIACSLAIQARAESPAVIRLAQGQERDLKPVYKGDMLRPKVTLIPNTTVVPIGGWINFRVSSSVSGYGHLYVLSASGRAQVWLENVPIVAGQRLVFPVGSTGIKASAPAGREDLMLIVTKQCIDGFFGYDTTRTPTVVDHDHKSFKAALTEKFINMPRRMWGYARTSVRVVDRSLPTWGWGKAQPDYWAGQWESD